MSTALDRLAEKIGQAHDLGLLPDEWHTLAQAALTERQDQWLSERPFRSRTGASDKWCRQNFKRCAEAGLARYNDRNRREWHVHARLPRRPAGDADAIRRQIVESFDKCVA